MNKNKEPFYKEVYDKVENEIGVLDTVIGLGLGAIVCALYWRYAWKNHQYAKITESIMRKKSSSVVEQWC